MRRSNLLILVLAFADVACVHFKSTTGTEIDSLGGKTAWQKGADGSESFVTDHDAAFATAASAIEMGAAASIAGSVSKAINSSNNAAAVATTKSNNAAATAAQASATKQAAQKVTPTVLQPGQTAVFPP